MILCVVCGTSVDDGHGHTMSAKFLTKKAGELNGMKHAESNSNPEGKEETKLEKYKTAINDARHIFTTYKAAHPDEAWDTIRRIIFDPKLK